MAKNKGTKMIITKGVELKLEAGKLALTADVGALALPVLQDLKAKVDSGEIDPIKGTDLDKVVLDKVLNQLIAALG